jgi:Ca2+-binding EF-hand superfamily protein
LYRVVVLGALQVLQVQVQAVLMMTCSIRDAAGDDDGIDNKRRSGSTQVLGGSTQVLGGFLIPYHPSVNRSAFLTSRILMAKHRIIGVPVPFGTGPPPPLSVRMFRKYDADTSGSITTDEFKFLCTDLGHRPTDAELDMALKIIDTDGSGSIGEKEFTKWWSGPDRFGSLNRSDEELERLAKASAVFQECDADNSGVLDRSEFTNLHAKLMQHGLVGDTDAAHCLASLDQDNSGHISFNEFVDWLARAAR